MELKDARIKAQYRGNTADGTHLFTPVGTQDTIKIAPENICGESILEFTDVYSLRMMPGGRYLVEGVA